VAFDDHVSLNDRPGLNDCPRVDHWFASNDDLAIDDWSTTDRGPAPVDDSSAPGDGAARAPGVGWRSPVRHQCRAELSSVAVGRWPEP
jgi:hypothetical protein